jgi:ribonuclease R
MGKNIPLIFRVHEEPSSESKEEFFNLARILGFALPPKPTVSEVQKLFEHAKQTPYAQQLSISFIRSMKLAIYSSENIGHYGLALEKYCHFTSPIRRYPDLIVQRLLFGDQKDGDLAPVAQRCSDKERVSFKAEQGVKILKKLRLLQQWFEEDPARHYVCQVTKIKPFSLGFELSPVGIEGSLHVSEIQGDYFVHDPEKNRFIGKRSGLRFGVGDTVTMRLLSVDLVLLEAKWQRVLEGSAPREERRNKKKRRRR